MLRRIVAVLAGFFAWSVLWLLANQCLVLLAPDRFQADGSSQDGGILLTILATSVGLSVFSGWLTARLAATAPLAHALALGVLLLLVGLLVQWQYWDAMPLWYHLSFLTCLLPASLFGGRLGARPAPSGYS